MDSTQSPRSTAHQGLPLSLSVCVPLRGSEVLGQFNHCPITFCTAQSASKGL